MQNLVPRQTFFRSESDDSHVKTGRLIGIMGASSHYHELPRESVSQKVLRFHGTSSEIRSERRSLCRVISGFHPGSNAYLTQGEEEYP